MAKKKRNKDERKKAAHMREIKRLKLIEIKRLKKIAKREHNENVDNNNIVLNKIPEVVIYSDDIVDNSDIEDVQSEDGLPPSPIPPRDPSTPIDRCRNINSLSQNNISAAKRRLKLVSNNNVQGVADNAKPSSTRVVNMDMLAAAVGNFPCVICHAKLEIQVSYLRKKSA